MWQLQHQQTTVEEHLWLLYNGELQMLSFLKIKQNKSSWEKSTKIRRLTPPSLVNQKSQVPWFITLLMLRLFFFFFFFEREIERERDTQLFKWFLNILFLCFSVRVKNVGLSSSKKICFIYFNKIPLKMMENT